MLSDVVMNKERFVSIVWILYNIGDKNMNENLIGFVILVKNEVNVRLVNILVIVLCFFGLVVVIIVKYVVGKLNIIIGKKLVINIFVVLLFVRKWVILLLIILFVVFVKFLNIN